MSEVIKHTPKLWERKNDTCSFFLFWCPGCQRGHIYETPRWKFDGNVEAPTFSPSLLMYVTLVYPDELAVAAAEGKGTRRTECHLHVRKGQLEYCGDCPHALSGKTIPMEEIPADYGF